MKNEKIEKEYQKHLPKFRYRAWMMSQFHNVPKEEYLSIYNEAIVRVARGEMRTAKFSTILHSAMINSENKILRDIGEKTKLDITEETEQFFEEDSSYSRLDMLRPEDYPPDTEEVAIRNKEKDDLRQQIVDLHANAGFFQKKLLTLLKQDRFYNGNTGRLNKTDLAKELSCTRHRVDYALKKLKAEAIKRGISLPSVS